MVRKKTTPHAQAKRIALALSVLILIIPLFSFLVPGLIPPPARFGIACCPSPLARLSYPFFHASIFHAALNAWCLLSVVFLYDISFPRLLAALIAGAAVPDCCLSSTPTVGLSCLCFFLLASITPRVPRKRYYSASLLFYIAIGFLFPSVNPLIHLYGYFAGLAFGLISTILPHRAPKPREGSQNPRL